MKRLCLPLLCVLCFVLSGCGQNAAKAHFTDFTEQIKEKDTLSFTSDIRCEYEDKTVSFTLAYASDREGSSVTVIAPELVRGIRAHTKAGDTALEYEGIILDTGPLDDFGLSPMSALPMLVESIKNGYIDSVWEEKGEYAALIVPSDHMNVQLHLDKYTMCPVYAELVSDGRVAAFIHIRDWT